MFVITAIDLCLVGTHLRSLDLSVAAVENRLSPWGSVHGEGSTDGLGLVFARRGGTLGSTDSLREQVLAWLKGGLG